MTFSGICRGSEKPIAVLTPNTIPAWRKPKPRGTPTGDVALAADRPGLCASRRRIAPGENIVLVLAASQHRQAAFAAAEFLMDYLKASAPFWKREESARGTSWIEARDHDDAAKARWTKS